MHPALIAYAKIVDEQVPNLLTNENLIFSDKLSEVVEQDEAIFYSSELNTLTGEPNGFRIMSRDYEDLYEGVATSKNDMID